MAGVIAGPIADIGKKALDELAKSMTAPPELNYDKFYGTRDVDGKHPSDDVLKHIATQHYFGYSLRNILMTVVKVMLYITIIVALFQLGPYIGTILEFLGKYMSG